MASKRLKALCCAMLWTLLGCAKVLIELQTLQLAVLVQMACELICPAQNELASVLKELSTDVQRQCEDSWCESRIAMHGTGITLIARHLRC